MCQGQVLFEVFKLVAQFVGALIIARQAVKWALGRYKSEKIWERRMSAYTDLLVSLAQMDQVLGLWELDALSVPLNLSDEEEADILRRYNGARQSIEEAWGAAQIILPDDVATMLASFSTDIDNARHRGRHDRMEAIGEEWVILQKARNKIVAAAKKDLQSPTNPPLFRKVIKSSSNA